MFETFVPVGGKQVVIQVTDLNGLSNSKTVKLDRSASADTASIAFESLNPLGRKVTKNKDALALIIGIEKYKNTVDFIKNETLTVTYDEPGPSGQMTTMTTINLKRKTDETPEEDGTHISCRFLDDAGACSMHPDRPGVCYLYPFASWLENEGGKARVHATYQFTGDCPGFYLADNLDQMKEELQAYSTTIYDYNMASNRTNREGFSAVSFS